MAATLEDYKNFTGKNDYTPEEETQIEIFLNIAEELILDYTHGIWENSKGSSVIANGRQIHIVRKYFNNQLGITSESADGFSQSFDERASEGLRLTNEDKRILDTLRSRPSYGIGWAPVHRNPWGRAW